MGALSLTLLGPPQLWHDGQPLPTPPRKVLLLLSYLQLEPGRHAREDLAGLFWPDSEPDVARSALRTALTQLRRLLPDHLKENGSLVEFQLQPGDTIDVLSDEVAPSDQPFLLGLEVSDEGELQDWLTAMRHHLQRQQRTRLQKHAQQLERTGQLSQAFELAERWFALDRTDEDAARMLMTLTGRMGDAEQVRAVYERHRHALAQQVDAPPSPQIQGLLVDLQAELVQAKPEGASDADVFRFPPLPVRASSFVGRQEELAQVQAVVLGGARLVTLQGIGGIGKTRLALALGATLQSTFPERIAFVPLETVQSPQEVPEAIFTALNLTGESGVSALERVIQVVNVQPSLLILDNFEQLLDGTALVDTLLTRCPTLTLLVTSREALNLQQEHRVPIPGLAQAAGQDLRLDADPAALPPSDAAQLFVQRARQVQSGFQLTESTQPQMEQLCRLLGGTPLAIELAASWLKVLTLEELLHDLSLDLDVVTSTARNLPARQQSLRVVFEYSWTRLSPPEQQALAALSVFRGGFSREAAREVAGASIQTLARLVDTSLLQVNRDGRFERHPLIFQFALEKLEGTGDAEHVRAEHARYFVDLAARAFPQLDTPGRGPWLDRLEAEQQNLTLTLEHLRGTGQAQALLGLCADLTRYWMQRDHEVVGRQWLQEAIPNAGAAVGTLSCARAQCMLGVLFGALAFVPSPDELLWVEDLQWLRDGVEGCRRGGDQRTLAFGLRALAMWRTTPAPEARHLVEEARQLSGVLGDPTGLVMTENALGVIALRTGDSAEAQRCFERALTLAQNLADPSLAQGPRLNLARLSIQRSDYPRAVQLYETGLSVYQQLGQVSDVANTFFDLGGTHLELGDFEAAKSALQQALGHYRHLGYQDGAALVLMNLASTAIHLNELEDAERLLQAAEREAGAQWRWPEWKLTMLGQIHRKRQQPEAARTAFLTVLSRPSTVNNSLPIASALQNYLTLPHSEAEIAELAQLLGALSVIIKAEGTLVAPPQSRADYAAGQQRIIERARNELGEAVFKQLVGAARQLPLAEAAEVVRQHAAALLETAPPVP